MITLAQYLPEFAVFLQQISADYQSGNIADWSQFRAICNAFYSPECLAEIEVVVPGWQKMASYADQQTLVHVTAVFVGLYGLPEYQTSDSHQQALSEWIVLWHDIAKEARPLKRDYTHGFRSAALTGKALPSLGFEVTEAYAEAFNSWYQLTHSAAIYSELTNDLVQDNERLPEIISGIDHVFETDAALVIKTVLLHMSLTVVQEWPAAAPLTDDEIRAFVTPDLLPLLRIMMLVDNIAWALFEPERQADELQQTREEFSRIKALI